MHPYCIACMAGFKSDAVGFIWFIMHQEKVEPSVGQFSKHGHLISFRSQQATWSRTPPQASIQCKYIASLVCKYSAHTFDLKGICTSSFQKNTLRVISITWDPLCTACSGYFEKIFLEVQPDSKRTVLTSGWHVVLIGNFLFKMGHHICFHS